MKDAHIACVYLFMQTSIDTIASPTKEDEQVILEEFVIKDVYREEGGNANEGANHSIIRKGYLVDATGEEGT